MLNLLVLAMLFDKSEQEKKKAILYINKFLGDTMYMKKKILATITMFSLLLSLSSCNVLQGKVEDNSLSKVMKNNKLVIGMEYSIPPMGVLDPSTGEAQGFDVDVANELGARMGVNVEFTHVPWSSSGKIETFEKSKADCIWNAFDPTNERENTYALSVPYIDNRKIFLTTTREAITTQEDLAGKVLGVGKGSSSEYILNNLDNQSFRSSLADVVTFDESYDQGVNMLKTGKIDAILMDEVVALHYKNMDSTSLKILQDDNGATAYVADKQCVVAFRRNQRSLRSEVNKLLVEMSKDGTISEISQRWFNEDITVIK